MYEVLIMLQLGSFPENFSLLQVGDSLKYLDNCQSSFSFSFNSDRFGFEWIGFRDSSVSRFKAQFSIRRVIWLLVLKKKKTV